MGLLGDHEIVCIEHAVFGVRQQFADLVVVERHLRIVFGDGFRGILDELPQLFNILRGDMSVVGNRPLPLYEAERLTSDEYIERFTCPSGLTGLWQVEKRGQAGKLSPEQRKQLDIEYARRMSPWFDLKIILRTFTAFIQKENV